MMRHPRISPPRCPHCGRVMQHVRAGVKMTPIKARIFDLIFDRPGISRAEIAETIFKTRERTKTVAAHIWQINELLQSTDVRLRGLSFYGYRVVSITKERDAIVTPDRSREARTHRA